MKRTLKIIAVCLLLMAVCGIFMGCSIIDTLHWTYGILHQRGCYVDSSELDKFADDNIISGYYCLENFDDYNGVSEIGYLLLSNRDDAINEEIRNTTKDFEVVSMVIAIEFNFENDENVYVYVNLNDFYKYKLGKIMSFEILNFSKLENLSSLYNSCFILPYSDKFNILSGYECKGIIEDYYKGEEKYKNGNEIFKGYSEYRYADEEFGRRISTYSTVDLQYGLITIFDNRSISETEKEEWHIDFIKDLQNNIRFNTSHVKLY